MQVTKKQREIAVVGCMLAIFLTGCSPGPKDVVQDFYAKLSEGDVSAMTLVCSEDRARFERAMRFLIERSEVDGREAHRSSPPTGNVLAFVTENWEGDEAFVKVDGTLEGAIGFASINKLVKLNRSGGDWCLYQPTNESDGIDDYYSGYYSELLPGALSDLANLVDTPSNFTGDLPEFQGRVRTTSSGLEYGDVVVGIGSSPRIGDDVFVTFGGWLEVSGTALDAQLSRINPFTFRIGTGEVISGFEEGIASMKEGGVRRIVVPPDLGFGETGRAPDIPPNATLIWYVELLDVQSTAD